MKKKYRILWVEDNAAEEFSDFLTPFLMDPKFVLDIAYDATEAFNLLKDNAADYDAVIFDLDLPTGDNPYIQEIYTFCARHEHGKDYCLLGCHLLRLWLNIDEGILNKGTCETLSPLSGSGINEGVKEIICRDLRLTPGLDIKKVAVLSIFAESVWAKFEKMKFRQEQVVQKTTGKNRNTLYDLVMSIISDTN